MPFRYKTGDRVRVTGYIGYSYKYVTDMLGTIRSVWDDGSGMSVEFDNWEDGHDCGLFLDHRGWNITAGENLEVCDAHESADCDYSFDQIIKK